MKEMSEKTIYQILNLVSVLGLSYFAVTSVNYILETEVHIYSYDTQNNSNWSTGQLEARQ